MNKYLNKVTVINTKEVITDTKDLNNFGVLFHDTKTIEQFQKRSGMEGIYTTEYQHHYINAIGRIEAEGQILDIAIPLVLYNYHQEVAGASVEFNLGEVGEADKANKELAIVKFAEFEETDMFKALVDMGITTWKIEGMNSIHAHPTGINRFSGTDLRANFNHPGVNFPLNTGENLSNFASIIQHKENFAELIWTEYRIFNGIANGERAYKKGRCMTIIRGYENEPAPDPIPDGLIDKIFGTSRPKPKTVSNKDRKHYIIRDEFSLKEGKTFSQEMLDIWKACPFKIDISSVLKTNVLKGRGRLQNKKYPQQQSQFMGDDWGYSSHRNKKSKKKETAKFTEETVDKINYLEDKGYKINDIVNWSQFEINETYKIEKEEDEPTIELPELYVMKAYLTKHDYKYMQMNLWTDQEIEDTYSLLILSEKEEAEEKKMQDFLLENGYTQTDLNSWTEEEILNAYTIMKIEKEDEIESLDKDVKITGTESRKYMADMLIKDKVFRPETLYPLTFLELKALYKDVYEN